MSADAFDYDVFVSRRGSQAAAAREVVDALVAGGWPEERILSQDSDMGPGAHFMEAMHRAADRARHFVVVLSADYDDSVYTRRYEFLTFLANADAGTDARRLIVLRVDDVAPPGLMRPFVFVDLVDVADPATRRQRIQDAVAGRTQARRPGPPVFHGVPARLAHFTGREDLLAELRGKLLAQETSEPAAGADRPGGGSVAVTQALAGLGGTGKTMLAAEYAHRHSHSYAGVWWAPAEQRALLLESLAGLAGVLDRRWKDAQDQEAAAKAALDLLRRRGALVPWLLVYDNVETPEAIADLKPTAGAHLLVTTRHRAWEGPRSSVDVGLFDRATSTAFLQDRAGRTDLDGAARLAEALGDLPLALDHAAAYGREAQLSFDAYLRNLDAVLARRADGAPYHGRRDAEATVHGTFTVALDRADQASARAGELMELLSVLGAEPVPIALLDAAMPELERADAVQALSRLDLVGFALAPSEAPALTVHRLVARVARSRAEAAGRLDDAVQRATAILTEAFPDEAWREPEQWPRCADLLPHVLAVRGRWTPAAYTDAALELVGAAAGYLYGRAAYPEAEPLHHEALAITRAIYGRDHPKAATSLSNLAELLRRRGRLADAEPLIREALAIDEQAHGRAHPVVAIRLNVLALLTEDLGRLDEAERLYKEAIAIGETSCGRAHPTVATWLNNLAGVLGTRGRPDEAERLYGEAIEIGEASYGRADPAVAIWIYNLARLLHDRGRPEKAESFYREALTTFETKLGPEHPKTHKASGNLARLLEDQGRTADAAQLRGRYGL